MSTHAPNPRPTVPSEPSVGRLPSEQMEGRTIAPHSDTGAPVPAVVQDAYTLSSGVMATLVKDYLQKFPERVRPAEAPKDYATLEGVQNAFGLWVEWREASGSSFPSWQNAWKAWSDTGGPSAPLGLGMTPATAAQQDMAILPLVETMRVLLNTSAPTATPAPVSAQVFLLKVRAWERELATTGNQITQRLNAPGTSTPTLSVARPHSLDALQATIQGDHRNAIESHDRAAASHEHLAESCRNQEGPGVAAEIHDGLAQLHRELSTQHRVVWGAILTTPVDWGDMVPSMAMERAGALRQVAYEIRSEFVHAHHQHGGSDPYMYAAEQAHLDTCRAFHQGSPATCTLAAEQHLQAAGAITRIKEKYVDLLTPDQQEKLAASEEAHRRISIYLRHEAARMLESGGPTNTPPPWRKAFFGWEHAPLDKEGSTAAMKFAASKMDAHKPVFEGVDPKKIPSYVAWEASFEAHGLEASPDGKTALGSAAVRSALSHWKAVDLHRKASDRATPKGNVTAETLKQEHLDQVLAHAARAVRLVQAAGSHQVSEALGEESDRLRIDLLSYSMRVPMDAVRPIQEANHATWQAYHAEQPSTQPPIPGQHAIKAKAHGDASNINLAAADKLAGAPARRLRELAHQHDLLMTYHNSVADRASWPRVEWQLTLRTIGEDGRFTEHQTENRDDAPKLIEQARRHLADGRPVTLDLMDLSEPGGVLATLINSRKNEGFLQDEVAKYADNLKTLSQLEAEGATAFLNGMTETDNPHSGGAVPHEAWRTGYLVARIATNSPIRFDGVMGKYDVLIRKEGDDDNEGFKIFLNDRYEAVEKSFNDAMRWARDATSGVKEKHPITAP